MRAVDVDLKLVDDVVRNYSSERYDKIIEEKKNASLIYHLSRYRWHAFEWIPLNENATVLEIGSECGAITSYLSKKVSKVYCVETDTVKMKINKMRHEEAANIIFCEKGLEEAKKHTYDYIFLPGSLARAEELLGAGDVSYQRLLKVCKSLLKENGQIFIATENRLGLKYWAGCKEDYYEAEYVGVEGYADRKGYKTFSKSELKQMLETAELTDVYFYYPYPDYVFCDHMYSDDWLPKKGELTNNQRNFEKDRYIFFDEFKVYNSLIGEELFSEFANSYFIVAR